VSDRMRQKGAKDAPAFQRGDVGGTAGPGPEVSQGQFVRRDRWGKLTRIDTCAVCGRRLWVNWTRARPCLFCDDAAREAKL
jgi:hypothetical protein